MTETPQQQPHQTAPAASQPTPASKKSNACLWIVLVIVGLFILMGIAASIFWGFFAAKFSGKVAETVISKVSNNTVNINTDSGSVTVRGEDGTTATIGTTLPVDFPKDIPLYTGATVNGASTGKDSNGKPESAVSMSTTDSVTKVQAFYDAQLATNGWTKKESVSTGPLVSFTAEKGTNQLGISLTSDESTHATLIVIVETTKQAE